MKKTGNSIYHFMITAALTFPFIGYCQNRLKINNEIVPEIRTFKVSIPESDISELRRRIHSTRWPDKETVQDQTQGVQLQQIKELVAYWGDAYNWRNAEARLNALPQFITDIDGIDIHFIHVKSSQPNALPIIITHGWPGSVFELLKIIDPLTNSTSYGGIVEEAFDVVIPSMPGYGFSLADQPVQDGMRTGSPGPGLS